MSTFLDDEIGLPIDDTRGISSVQFAAIAALFSVLGLATIWPTILSLWALWTDDPLKSIGMMVPLVSFILVLRVWKTLGWQAEGTWWGLIVLAVTTVVAKLQEQALLIFVISPHWSTILPPPSLTLWAYGSGVVLLLGGVRLYRAALFPIFLLCFANPIPHVFSSLIDLPLQHVSAHVARAFAMSMGNTLTPDNLRLMFTPDFGMFIAPGCNGIRGSVTMGFIALIAGYVYRFRWYLNGLVVLGAILLGYVFNLARLCLLVLYYVVALHVTWLQGKAENGDYLIGAVLFLVAAILLFTVIHHLRDTGNPNVVAKSKGAELAGAGEYAPRARYAQLVTMGAIVLIGCTGLGQARTMIRSSALSGSTAAAAEFPGHIGNYTLVRTWNEDTAGGTVIYVWGQYAPIGGGEPIAIGVSPIPNYHDPILCHSIRGEDPLWQGQFTVATKGSAATDFSSALFSDGVTRHIEASTMCRAGACGEFTTERDHFGFIYTRPDRKFLFDQTSEVAVRVLLRIETPDMATPGDSLRQQLTADLRAFLANVEVADLTRPYSR